MKEKLFSQETLSIVLLAIVTVLLVVNTLGRYSALEELQTELQQEKQVLEQEKVRLQRLYQVREQAPQFQETVEAFNKMIPEKAARPHLLTFMQDQAFASGMKLLRLDLGEEDVVEDYAELPMELSLQATYHGTMEMLYSLQQGQRIIRVESIEIDGTEPDHLLQVEINACTFFQY